MEHPILRRSTRSTSKNVTPSILPTEDASIQTVKHVEVKRRKVVSRKTKENKLQTPKEPPSMQPFRAEETEKKEESSFSAADLKEKSELPFHDNTVFVLEESQSGPSSEGPVASESIPPSSASKPSSHSLRMWLNDHQTDLSPYFFSKLDFLQTMGRRCRSQPVTTDCHHFDNDPDACAAKDMRCSYSVDDDTCDEIIDSICNYFDEHGHYIEEHWTDEQVDYIDDLYQQYGSIEYGKFLSSERFKQTVQTNAFQLIFRKLKMTREEVRMFEKKTCYFTLNRLLLQNDAFMNSLHAQRKTVHDKLYPNDPYDASLRRNNFVKLPELTHYVFEVMRKKKMRSIQLWVEYSDHFPHDHILDQLIWEKLDTIGLCKPRITGTTGTTQTTPLLKDIPIDIRSALTADDFHVPTNASRTATWLWTVVNLSISCAKQMIWQFGSCIMSLLFFIVNHFESVLVVLVVFVVAFQFMDVSTFTLGWAKWIATKAGISSHDTVNALLDMKPTLNRLYVLFRDIICTMLPVVANSHVTALLWGQFFGNRLATAKYMGIWRGNVLFDVLRKSPVMFMNLLTAMLRCSQRMRAVGPERSFVFEEVKAGINDSYLFKLNEYIHFVETSLSDASSGGGSQLQYILSTPSTWPAFMARFCMYAFRGTSMSAEDTAAFGWIRDIAHVMYEGPGRNMSASISALKTIPSFSDFDLQSFLVVNLSTMLMMGASGAAIGFFGNQQRGDVLTLKKQVHSEVEVELKKMREQILKDFQGLSSRSKGKEETTTPLRRSLRVQQQKLTQKKRAFHDDYIWTK